MMRKSLIAALGIMGLVAIGSMASATPASAGYACGPWNGWCSYVKPGWGWYGGGYYGKRYYGHRSYGHRHWSGNKKFYKGGKKKHTHKRSNKRHWR